MIVIGIVGEKGGGKGTFARIVSEVARPKIVLSVRFSDILYETLRQWGIAPSRENLQKLAIVMNGAYGDGTLAKAVAARIGKLTADIVIVEGMRWDADEPLIRSLPGNVVVYITAPAALRHVRTLKRGEKAGESETSFEQFMREEQAPTEVKIPLIGSRADFKIVNDGTMEQYRAEVERVLHAITARR